MAKSPQERICDHIKSILENSDWQNLDSPEVFLGLTLWDPENQKLPLITIIPRIEKATGQRYGNIECELPIEITVLIPMANGQDTMIGLAVANEITACVFRARENNWAGYPDHLIDIIYVDGGIISYPDEINPQLLTAGITINAVYEKKPYPYTFGLDTGKFRIENSLK